MSKKTKLRFTKDGIINGEIVYPAGTVHEFSNDTGSVDRWIKRGAVIVGSAEDKDLDIPQSSKKAPGQAPKAPESSKETTPVVQDITPPLDTTPSADSALDALGGGYEDVVNGSSKEENKEEK